MIKIDVTVLKVLCQGKNKKVSIITGGIPVKKHGSKKRIEKTNSIQEKIWGILRQATKKITGIIRYELDKKTSQPTSWSFWPRVVLCVFCLIAIVTFFFTKYPPTTLFTEPPIREKQSKPQHKSASPTVRAFLHTASTYFQQGNAPQWIVTQESIEMQDKHALAPAGKDMLAKIEHALQHNQSLPKVQKIQEKLAGKFSVAFYTRKHVPWFISEEKEEVRVATPSFDSSPVAVVIYASELWGTQHLKGNLIRYSRDSKYLNIAGVAMNEIWFEALVLHELFHLFQDRQGKAYVRAPAFSKSWTQGEIKADIVSRKVLDLRTNGKYNQILQQILEKYSSEKFTDLLGKISLEDLHQLDSLFGPANQKEYRLRFTQYIMDLEKLWLNNKTNGKLLQKYSPLLYKTLLQLECFDHPAK